jgi:hypothetical protein
MQAVMKKRTKNKKEAVDDQDKKIAAILKIPILENKDSYTLFSDGNGTEIVFKNKKHLMSGNILYIVDLNRNTELKELVFIDSILNLISLIRSKKYSIKSNTVFIICNNPQDIIIKTIKSRFKMIYNYLFAYPKTIQGKIQTVKTILLLNEAQDVKVFNQGDSLSIQFNNKLKIINSAISYSRLLRDFNFQKLHINSINLGYNVYNLKHIYGYKD